jgi:hypothetical protein
MPTAATVEQTGVGKHGGIRWLTNPFQGNGDAGRFIIHFELGLGVFTAGFARQVEAYAKEHAPWDDRTGDARAGLTAKGEQRLVYYAITLYHTVSYGIWLEVRWDGKYAIIVPTLEHMGPQLMIELGVLGMGGIATLGGGRVGFD